MIEADRNSIRYMALRAKMLKLCARLEDDVNFLTELDNDYDGAVLGKLEAESKILDWIMNALSEADKVGEKVVP